MKKKSRRHPRRYTSVPLHASIMERTSIPMLTCSSEPEATPRPQTIMLTPPPKPARDILALLLASTGFALAGVPNANVELLPGAPTTVVIHKEGKAQAAFVLPISEAEACKAFGMPSPEVRDHELEALWEEDHHAG